MTRRPNSRPVTLATIAEAIRKRARFSVAGKLF